MTEILDISDVAADKLDEAIRKLGILTSAEAFTETAVRDGSNRSDAVAAFCCHRQIAIGTLYRWRQAYRKEGLLGLVDGRGKGKFQSDSISDEAFEFFKSAWLVPQQPSVKMIWRILRFHAQQHQLAWQIPSLRTMYDIVEARIPLPVQVLHRQGQAAYDARCAPYILTDPDSIEPGAVWVGDHHEADCFVRHDGKWMRPWLTTWMDMRSRSIVGCHVSLSPNQTTIMLAFRDAVRQYGPPDTCHIDNGKDYDSEMFTGTTKTRRRLLGKNYIDEDLTRGIYAMMGILVIFAIPYHPQSKPIERWFATFEGQFVKTLPTYCGPATDRKPEELADYLKTHSAIDKGLNLDEFTGLVGRYIAAYNATAHTGAGMDERSPNEVMATRTSRKVILDGVLDLLCRVWSGELVVGKNGVRFRGLWFGQYDPALLMHQGKKVRVSFDPADLTSVHVYDATTLNLITIAEQAQLVRYGTGADETALREAHAAKARARKAVRRHRDETRTANMDLVSLTMEAMESNTRPEPEPDADRSIRPAATALDGQVGNVQRRQTARAVRKAAGAEQITHVRDLDFDVDLMRQNNGRRPVDQNWI
jgi:putative transposase